MKSCGILAMKELAWDGDTHIVFAYQVMESQAAKVGGLNAKILEGLCCRVNLLVNELSLNLICRKRRPPQGLVKDFCDRFENSLGNIDMTAVFDDLTVYEFRNFCSRIILGPIEFVSLGGSAVIVTHLL